jgi:hypothetical protein
MTIDEAISHCLEVAEEQSRLYSLCPCPCDGMKNCMSLKNGKDMGCTKCAADHRQLAEWLTELKEAKSIIRVCNRVLGYLLECEIENTSTRHEVETLLKNMTGYLSGGDENG